METKITKPRVETNEEKTDRILTVEVRRNASHGLQIFVQSDKDWSQFREETGKTSVISGVVCHHPKADNFKGIQSGFVRANGYDTLFYGGMPNLIILLARDIKAGVTFNLGMFPIQTEMIKSWGELLDGEIKRVYNNYCKPFKMSVEFVVTRTTNEIID